MEHTIIASLQITPKATGNYVKGTIDKAIKAVENSGLKYEVCPMETVIEGSYEEVMRVAKEAQDACLEAGSEAIVVYMKIFRKKDADVHKDDKMDRYR